MLGGFALVCATHIGVGARACAGHAGRRAELDATDLARFRFPDELWAPRRVRLRARVHYSVIPVSISCVCSCRCTWAAPRPTCRHARPQRGRERRGRGIGGARVRAPEALPRGAMDMTPKKTTPRPGATARATRSTTPPTVPATRQTVIIENVAPTVDGGRYAAEREIGARVEVSADISRKSRHLVAVVRCRPESDRRARGADALRRQRPLGRRDVLDALGRWVFKIEALIDPFQSGRGSHEARRGIADVTSELLEGARSSPRRRSARAATTRGGSASTARGSRGPGGERAGRRLATLMARISIARWRRGRR